MGETETERLGQFGNAIRLEGYFLFLAIFIALGLGRFKPGAFSFRNNLWLYILILFCLISILNPVNPFVPSIFVFLFSFFQLIVILKVIESNFSRGEIIKGIFDALLLVSILQLFLVICYPVLGIQAATTWFRGEQTLETTLKREGYNSAVGIFGHPGPLALFCLIVTIFYVSCYLNRFKMKKSLILIVINIVIILLTFSRTTYITCIGVLTLIYIVYKQREGLFSFKNLAMIFSIFIAFLLVLYLTPLSDVFLKSDAESQIDNRFAHWYLGYQTWLDSPWIGVGINSHVYYMAHVLQINADLPILWFLTSNPIHNIHFIILSEVGVIGLVFWVYFFISQINFFSKHAHTLFLETSILNLATTGILVAFFLYGFFGWAPFTKEVFNSTIFLCYFSAGRKEMQVV
ncbi:MAG: O-antigen ligase family protein [Chitinophagaceae bacterium]|nr:O-antigen ligase family protein [Chitinophagaceae bacterium]